MKALLVKCYILCVVSIPYMTYGQSNNNSLINTQAGSIDLSFNPNDIGFGNGDGFNGYVNACVLQSDGMIVVAGWFDKFNKITKRFIVRLTTDGALDTTFNTQSGSNGPVHSIAIQTDGKILIGGMFTLFDGVPRNRVARLLTNGSIDTTFNPGTGANGIVKSISVQSDGKIILGGEFTQFNGLNCKHMIRVLSDGTVDTLFNIGTGFNYPVNSTAIQNDGKILVGGNFNTLNGQGITRMIRLENNGNIDTTFSVSPSHEIYTIKIQADQKVLIGGNFSSVSGINQRYVARLLPDGTPDTTFSVSINGKVHTISLLAGSSIFIGGGFGNVNGLPYVNLAVLDSSGIPIVNINNAIRHVNDLVLCSTVSNDGKIIIGGEFHTQNSNFGNRIRRLLPDGSTDYNFNAVSGINGSVYYITADIYGQIYLGGQFTVYNNQEIRGIVRILHDGQVDTTFDFGIALSGYVTYILPSPDGKIFISGSLNGFGSNPTYPDLFRINQNGSLDNSFSSPGLYCFDLSSVDLLPDGKILIGGLFQNTQSGTNYHLVRLFPNGTIDNSFNLGSGFDMGYVYDVLIDQNGKILATGSFSAFNGYVVNRMVRLNSNGTYDPSFSVGVGPNGWVHKMYNLSDGSIIAIGDFSSFNNVPANKIAKLNPDGSVNMSFNSGSGFTTGVLHNLWVQSDGKMIIGGDFSSYNGTSVKNLIRIMSDGSLDTSFNVGIGPDDDVRTCFLQPDDKILIGGTFTSVDSIGRNRVARLHNDIPVGIVSLPNSEIKLYPNPNSGDFNITVPVNMVMIIYNSIGEEIHSDYIYAENHHKVTLPSTQGLYFVNLRAVDTGLSISYKIIRN